MLDEIFVINLIANDGDTVVKEEEFPNPNWLVLTGSFDEICEIQLSWETSLGTTIKSSGIYYVKTGDTVVGSRVIVNALVENARGSDGKDFIQGNEVSNIIYGDYTADGAGGDDILWGAAGNDEMYGGDGQDEVAGGEDNDVLYGNDGNDIMNGDSGIDRIEGGVGADDLSGGSDAGDTVAYTNSDAGVTVRLTAGDSTTGRGGDAAGDTIRGFTGVIGSAFDDNIKDTVVGSVGSGQNDNTFEGGDGHDRLVLGGGNDRGLGGKGDDDILGGLGEDIIEAGDGNDYCDGGENDDQLWGESGNDALLGRGGKDRLFGGEGDDRLLGGDGADRLLGLDDNDLLRGESGADELSGGSGLDRLIGGSGPDELSGGGDADTFVFTDISDSGITDLTRDTITDFKRNEGDKIDLSGIDANPSKAGNNAFVFLDAASFSGTPGELRLVSHPDGLLVLLNIDTDRAAEMTILVTDKILLLETDFIL